MRNHKENAARWHKKMVIRNRERINAAKDKPCADCSGKFPLCCMQFDHIPELGPKEHVISRMITRVKNTSKIDAEMAKCEVVCANCHAIRSESRRLERAIRSGSA